MWLNSVCVWLCMMGHIGYTILQYWSVLNLLVNHCFCFLTTSSLQGSMAAGSNTTNLIVWDSRLIWYNAYRHLLFSCLNHLIKGRFRRVCEVAALLLMKDRCAHLAFTAISALCILIVDVVTGEETYSKKRTAARSQTYCVSHRFAKLDRRGSHIYRFGSRTKPPAFSALSSVCPNIHIMTFTTRGFLDHARINQKGFPMSKQYSHVYHCQHFSPWEITVIRVQPVWFQMIASWCCNHLFYNLIDFVFIMWIRWELCDLELS